MTSVDELLSKVASGVERGHTPACQVAVGKDGDVVVFEAFGDASTESLLCAYSATKPIVASAVWLLLGEGRLGLGDHVAHHVPELRGDGWDGVTLEQVLLHTSGFPNAPMSAAEGSDPVARRERFARWRLEWEPGSRFEYHATSAHWVLVDLLERLEGRDFRDVVADRVCAPAGLPRVLGIPPARHHLVVQPHLVGPGDAEVERMMAVATPDGLTAGIPGGGGAMTAADLARFYQALLHNPAGMWVHDVWVDATSNVRCTMPEPMFGVAVNRTIGLVVAGDDGHAVFRYAGFGEGCSPASFGHAGAFMQIGWADPATGLSFAFLHNGLEADMTRAGARGVRLSGLAATLDL